MTNQLSIILKGYGISLERQGGNQVLKSLSESQLLEMLDEQNIDDGAERAGALQILTDSQELIAALNGKIQLLENIEVYLQDWLWGLTYQYIKHSDDEYNNENIKSDLL